MTQNRRMGVESSKVRARFVEAAELILREEGYHAISARHVAARAELKTQLLYYYFRTMDDLLLAVLRGINERRLVRFDEALASPQPLRALWALNIDPSGAMLGSELASIAGHREAIREEIVAAARQFRAAQIAAVSRLLAARGVKADDPAAGLVMIAVGLARTMVIEEALGLSEGHAEALAIVDAALTRLGEPPLPG
jgi:AcrR family transcriptional regulator